MTAAAGPVVAYVEWVDAGVLAANWRARDEVLGQGADDAKDPIRSAGFVLRDDGDGVILAASVNETHQDVQLALFIPRPCIQKMAVWTPAA